MPRGESSSGRSQLQLAIERNLRDSAALMTALQRLEDAVVHTEAEAEAVCQAATQLALEPEDIALRPLAMLARLFESVEKRKCPVFRILAERGIPSLVSMVRRALDHPTGLDRRDVLLALLVLARYRTRGGTAAILRAAQVPLHPDAYIWHPILCEFARHPHRRWLYKRLSDPIPPDFLGISLLDSAGKAFNGGAQGEHPFATVAGITRLRELISDDGIDSVSWARSAVYSIPYLNHPAADELLSLAFDHPSEEVQLEAALAAARLGRPGGVRTLQRACLDANLSVRAKFFLECLDQEQQIPPESNDEHFLARAEFADWLLHPNELGRPPDEVEIVDHRHLKWPLDEQTKPFWLVKYRVSDRNGLLPDDVGLGLVGSVTFCHFTDKLLERPPEDAYAIYYYLELTHSGQIVEAPPGKGEEYSALLAQYPANDLLDFELHTVCELSARLNYPQQIVGFATCRRGDEPGGVVLDGARSRFYSASEMPKDCFDSSVLMLHVGRVLLGFGLEADRRSYLKPPLPARDPAQFVEAYQRLVERERQRTKPGDFRILDSVFDEYVEALCHSRKLNRTAAINAAYSALISVAERWDIHYAREWFGQHSPLARRFAEHAQGLLEFDRHEEILTLIARFRNWWSPTHHSPLAKAAIQIGETALAREILQQIPPPTTSWDAHDHGVFVAELWSQIGDEEWAISCLVSTLALLRDEFRVREDADLKHEVANWFREVRAAYLNLFPERGQTELTLRGIPEALLSDSIS